MVVRILLAVALLAAPVSGEILDIPVKLRQENWNASDPPWNRTPIREGWPGSCVFASTVTLLRVHGFDATATYWRNNYQGGSSASKIVNTLNESNLKFALEVYGQEEFLDWACRNRLGAVIFFKPRHCCNLIDLTDTHAFVIDNNHPNATEIYTREKFLRMWKKPFNTQGTGGGNGFAFTLVYPPPPPWPSDSWKKLTE